MYSKAFKIFYFSIGIVTLLYQNCYSQTIQKENASFLTPEILIGKTLEANTDFPETNLQKNLFLSLGCYNFKPDKEWAARLNYPITGISFGYTDFGNTENIGHAYSILPFIEVSILKRQIDGLNLHLALGGSYMDTQYNIATNGFNKAITTKFNWSFRSFLYYDVAKTKTIDWRFGLGLLHHSNGHSKLPNQGLNSLLASISAKINKQQNNLSDLKKTDFKSKSQTYLSFRFGLGQNVLSKEFNTKKEVYTVSASAGKILNNTFKFGGGFYYRFYEHYYDYIKNNETLVEEQFPHYTENPYGYATAFGLFATSELLIDHIGIELNLGLNIYKPFYKIDWKINQGYDYQDAHNETVDVLGELNWYYKIKRTVSARMGLKYYLWTTNKAPEHNLFVGAHINANLGQADFSELSLGYVYRLNKVIKD
ncbi:acyloxyacyl hydrolase [Winogradskyella undariae]|uniref:acyloxyacyl hydrolase n=1 Tax=Winogradskyella undariae TaxID=1285465 RepID=UPI0015C7EEE9|nr:acyloxyacyl hydrolase [Winogradskyella undariae]